MIHERQIKIQILSLIWLDIILIKMQTGAIQLRDIDEFQASFDLFDIILREANASGDRWNQQPTHGDLSQCSSISSLGHEPTMKAQQVQEAAKYKGDGCSCTRSMCMKNYCPCHRNGHKCNSSCTCEGCKNMEFIPRRVRYIVGTAEQFSLMPFTL